MSWNGSGVFNRIYSWVADKAAGLDISSTRMDTDTNDIATNGFGNCLTRDGQGQPTANLPMASFRHTGVQNAVNRSDYAALNQAQDGLINWSIAGGSADAITATYTPTIGALTDGLLRGFRATAANTTTTPTFAPDSLTAHTITRFGGAALVAGDIAGNLAESLVRYNLANTRWELLNPAQPVAGAVLSSPTISGTATFSGTGEVNLPSGTTAQRPGSPVAGGTRFNSQVSAAEIWDGAAWRFLNSPAGVGPSVQSFTSGSAATFTTPASALYLVVEMAGGGGGGGGGGTGAASGTAGGTTVFNSINASGGAQGVASTTSNGQSGGAGGAGGTGSAQVRFPGMAGAPGGNANGGSPPNGGTGGSSVFGGAGSGGTPSINAGAAQSNSGSGGGGGGATATPTGGGGGGGAGEYARLVIANPAATYTYTVGAAGAGGSGGGGTNGGNGAAGVIIVTAYFQ